MDKWLIMIRACGLNILVRQIYPSHQPQSCINPDRKSPTGNPIAQTLKLNTQHPTPPKSSPYRREETIKNSKAQRESAYSSFNFNPLEGYCFNYKPILQEVLPHTYSSKSGKSFESQTIKYFNFSLCSRNCCLCISKLIN